MCVYVCVCVCVCVFLIFFFWFAILLEKLNKIKQKTHTHTHKIKPKRKSLPFYESEVFKEGESKNNDTLNLQKIDFEKISNKYYDLFVQIFGKYKLSKDDFDILSFQSLKILYQTYQAFIKIQSQYFYDPKKLLNQLFHKNPKYTQNLPENTNYENAEEKYQSAMKHATHEFGADFLFAHAFEKCGIALSKK